jgi:hypothetical protein
MWTPRKPHNNRLKQSSDQDIYEPQSFIKLTKVFNGNTLSTFFSLIIMYSILFYIYISRLPS